ncbi:response regulator transcription factor [Sphingomonas sp. FW199]|uniref:response regulator transcription factor n=1 Tax=Sphingomonas sp. FW199 TaxID=3400217 RepID=UPI003CF4E437
MQRHVYLIDDDPILRDSMALLLGLMPDLTLHAFDGGAAWLAVADGVPPGVVLLDQQMPGQTGIEVLAGYAGRLAMLPTLLMTGSADRGLEHRALAAGAMEMLVKPVPPEQLLAAIGRGMARLND